MSLIIYMVPTTVAREEGAEFVVAVTVTSDIRSEDRFSSAMDIYVRSVNVGSLHLERRLLREADVVIRPDVGKLHWTDFARAQELIMEGERATREKLRDLRKGLPLFRRWSPFHPTERGFKKTA